MSLQQDAGVYYYYGHSKDAAVQGLHAHTHQGRTTLSNSLSLSHAHFVCVCVFVRVCVAEYHEKEEERAKEDGKASHKLDSGSSPEMRSMDSSTMDLVTSPS